MARLRKRAHQVGSELPEIIRGKPWTTHSSICFLGLCLVIAVVVNNGLRVLSSKARLPVWMSTVSWIALILSIVSALCIEFLFLQRMTPAFDRQIGLSWLIIGGIGTLITAGLYRRLTNSRLANVIFSAQMIFCIVSLVLAFGLHRNLVPISPP